MAWWGKGRGRGKGENRCWEQPKTVPWLHPRFWGCPVPQRREQEAWMVEEATSEVVRGRIKQRKCQEGPVTDTLLPKLGTWITRLALYNSASSDAGRTACIMTFMGPDAVPTMSNGEVTLEQRAAELQGLLDKQTYLSRAGQLYSAAQVTDWEFSKSISSSSPM